MARLRDLIPLPAKTALYSWMSPRGLIAFLDTLPPGARVLDVGCGNNAPRFVKKFRPDVYYVGVDIADYNQSSSPDTYADEYHLLSVDHFADEIRSVSDIPFDAVISRHNLEHCNAPNAVVSSIASVLGTDGKVFFAFPSLYSVNFPSRPGTLNFFDDPTHKTPIDPSHVTEILMGEGLEITCLEGRYRPLPLATLGILLEPFSRATKRVDPYGAVWALYGFEAVVWCKRSCS